MSTKLLFGIMTVLAFGCAFCIISIDSAFADKHNANTPLTIGAIVLGLAAVFTLYKINKQSGTGKPDR